MGHGAWKQGDIALKEKVQGTGYRVQGARYRVQVVWLVFHE